MPFGGYADFAACVAANGDKADPKAYCGAIQAAAEKALQEDTDKRVNQQSEKQPFTVAKLDEAQRLVFGWASVSVTKDGSQLEDLQGDVIDPADLENAAYDFVLYSRNFDEMHQGRVKGQLIESFILTPEKLQAMGLAAAGSPQVGWWVGAKLDPDSFAKVKQGDYSMLSIECTAVPVEV